MEFYTGDILIRKPFSGMVVWVSEQMLIRVCDISEEYLRMKARLKYRSSVRPCHRNSSIMPVTGKSWRYARINNKFYYDLETIPNKKPKCYRNAFGDATELVNNYKAYLESKTKDTLVDQAKKYIEENYTGYYRCFLLGNEVQKAALAKACALFEFAIVEKMKNKSLTYSKVSKSIVKIVNELDVRYLPRNNRRFQEKLELHFNAGLAITDIIKLPRMNNSFALKHIDPEIKSWAIQMHAMGQNYSKAHIIRKVQKFCKHTGKHAPERTWFFDNVFNKTEVKFLTNTSKYGEGSVRAQIHSSYIPIKNALFAGDCWQIDATRVNIIPHTTSTGKQDFLFIIAVRDVHSGDILGYNFDYSENRWSVHNAIKMAVETAGYLPYEFVCDRFPGHNTPEMVRMFEDLERLGTNVTITHKATGKAQLERWFGTLQSVFMQDSDYYYGEGIKSTRPHAHRSAQYLKAVKKMAKAQGYDLTAAFEESAKMVETYRETKYSEYSRKYRGIDQSPMEIHQECEKPHVKHVNEAQISMIFGLKKQLKVANNGLIKTEIHKVEHYFVVDDYEIYAKNEKVIISYDPQDLSKVHVFKSSNGLLVHLGEAREFEPIQMYGPDAEYGRLAAEKSRIAEIEKVKAERLAEMTAGADETALLMGKLTNKAEANNAESIHLLNVTEELPLLKKASGDDSSTDLDDDFLNITNQL